MNGGPVTSPWTDQYSDYLGRVVQITITFNESTRAITGCTVFRDAACVFTRIYLGVGADGSPNSTNKVFTVAAGTSSVQLNQLRNNGLNVIEDVLALNRTAGP